MICHHNICQRRGNKSICVQVLRRMNYVGDLQSKGVSCSATAFEHEDRIVDKGETKRQQPVV